MGTDRSLRKRVSASSGVLPFLSHRFPRFPVRRFAGSWTRCLVLSLPFFLLLFLFPASAPSHLGARFYRGEIKVSTEWEGVIRLTGTVVVEEGVVLTVAPGTQVLVTGGRDVTIVVRGTLYVRGERDYPVVFDSADGCEDGEAWAGIHFLPGSRGELRNFRVECSEKGIWGATEGVKINYQLSGSSP
ncbi:MAG: hypothetical protein D6713_10085 [Deltaproteobacteria bacterium]|nr:MAG: hypothetical protein D6713_10085 [Deltaproteobacteria bacterium]